MKNKSLFKISLFIVTVLAVFSCSKSEDPIGSPQSTLVLELSSDANDPVLLPNEEINFTLKGSDSMDYTSAAQFFVNDTEIPGSSYTFTGKGAYIVKAVYDDVTSNTLDFNVVDPAERVITIDVPRALRNQTITFGLLDADGNNTASEATFFVNDLEITGNTYSSTASGNFEVYAKFEAEGESFTTETKEFSIFIPKRKVVLEDYTGTWCGYCPAVAGAITAVEELTPYISVVAIHDDGSTPDPYKFEDVDILTDQFEVYGLPGGRINRTIKWNAPYSPGDVLPMAGEETSTGIALKSQLSGSTLTVDVKLMSENELAQGNKLVVYLLENGLIHDQANYYDEDPLSPFHNMGDPIPNYIHNHTLRKSLSAVLGDNIPATPAFTEFAKNYSIQVPSEYNYSNLSLVVMLVTADNLALNSQHAAVNENKDYE